MSKNNFPSAPSPWQYNSVISFPEIIYNEEDWFQVIVLIDTVKTSLNFPIIQEELCTYLQKGTFYMTGKGVFIMC